MTTGAKLTGKEDMKARLMKIAFQFPERVGKALYEEMKIERAEVIKRTPKDSGALRESVKLIGPSVQDNGTITVLIVAGGPDAPYAMIVHEDLDAFHEVGQAKFLESVVMESRAYIGARVARRLNIADWVN